MRERGPKRARCACAAALVLAALLGVAACGTDDGSPPDGPTTQPTTSPTSSSRPPFDASLPDAGPDDAASVDPTPEGGDVCIDKNDPGATEATAKALAAITDDDSQGSSVSGVVNGVNDVDFYTFQGSDTIGHSVDPTITSATTGLEVCMFVACNKQPIDFKSCANGGAQATSGIGDPGCCVATPGTTTLSFSCGGVINTDDSAKVFIRVKQTADACLSYSVAYHF